MSNTIRTAIIGIGPSGEGKGGAHSIAYCHAWAYEASSATTLVAACSRTQKNVDDFLTDFPSCKGYNDYVQMLNEEKPDLVSVCAFAPDREKMVGAALEAGAKGILIEKPFALSLEAARNMSRKAKDFGARLFVNHQRRYGKPYEAARDAIANIGDLQSIDISQPFGNILDFGSHLIDMALFFAGPSRKAETLFAAIDWSDATDWHGTKVESHSLMSLYFDDGCRLTYEAQSISKIKTPLIRVNGSMGYIELHLEPAADVSNVYRARLEGSSDVSSINSSEHIHHSEDPALYMKRAVADIAHVMQNGGQTHIDEAEAMRGLEIMMAMYESAKNGVTVRNIVSSPKGR